MKPGFLLLLYAFAARARTFDAHDDACLRRVFDTMKKRAQTNGNYKPIVHPEASKLDEVSHRFFYNREGLKLAGVRFRVSDRPTRLQSLAETREIRPDHELFLGKVLELEGLPAPVRPGTPDTPALLHPKMRRYFDKMKEYGYALGIDTSLEQTNAGAYFRASDRLIAIRRNTSWTSFLHEFQHLEFDRYIAPDFGYIREALHSGKRLRDVLPRDVVRAWGRQRTTQLESLIGKRVPYRAVNETMAVEAELESLGWKRYQPRVGTVAAKYALRHQITELERVAAQRPLSPREQLTLWDARRRYDVMDAWDTWLPGAAAGTAVTGTAAALTWNAVRFDESRYSEIYYDHDGNIVGVEPSGNLVYSQRTPLGPVVNPLKR